MSSLLLLNRKIGVTKSKFLSLLFKYMPIIAYIYTLSVNKDDNTVLSESFLVYGSILFRAWVDKKKDSRKKGLGDKERKRIKDN